MSLWTAMLRRQRPAEESPLATLTADAGLCRLRNLLVSQYATDPDERSTGRVLIFVSPTAVGQVSQSLAHQLAESLARLPASPVLVLDATTSAATSVASLPQLVVPTTRRGVHTVLGGLSLPSDVGLSAALITFVNQCRRRFAWTLVDASTSAIAGLVELARRADGVYIVLPQCGTSRAAAEQTIRSLRRHGIAATACLWVESPRRQAGQQAGQQAA